MSKKVGLAAFAQQTPEVEVEEPRTRGKSDVVGMTMRLPRDKWERVHQLALSEGVSVQRLMLRGLAKLFAEKGLPPLNPK